MKVLKQFWMIPIVLLVVIVCSFINRYEILHKIDDVNIIKSGNKKSMLLFYRKSTKNYYLFIYELNGMRIFVINRDKNIVGYTNSAYFNILNWHFWNKGQNFFLPIDNKSKCHPDSSWSFLDNQIFIHYAVMENKFEDIIIEFNK